MKKKAFTLVELIVVLVILAIVTLIVTPLVLGILKNAEKRARERSVDGYGKAIETAFFSYELSYGNITTEIDKLDIKYSGDKIICDEAMVRENGEVYLSKCAVGGVYVKDSNTDDGYYHYGLSNREYIKKYAIALENQIASNEKDNNETIDIATLNNKYSKSVSCNKKHVNYNNSVYLSECSVGGIEEKDETTEDGYYHYGYLQTYKTGDEIKYNGINFYVIADSGLEQDYVTLLKETPLTMEEVSKYGNGNINKYTEESVGVPYKYGNNYGGVAYFSSVECGYPTPDSSSTSYHCRTEYYYSDIYFIVELWASHNLKNLKKVDGYGARLITIEELSNLGCSFSWSSGSCKYSKYKWLYSDSEIIANNSNDLYYYYWTMPYEASYRVMNCVVEYNGYIDSRDSYDYRYGVRPVINLYKKAI